MDERWISHVNIFVVLLICLRSIAAGSLQGMKDAASCTARGVQMSSHGTGSVHLMTGQVPGRRNPDFPASEIIA